MKLARSAVMVRVTSETDFDACFRALGIFTMLCACDVIRDDIRLKPFIRTPVHTVAVKTDAISLSPIDGGVKGCSTSSRRSYEGVNVFIPSILTEISLGVIDVILSFFC